MGGAYICEFKDCFCLNVDILGFDFLSAVVDGGVDVLCLGALVGADALDELVQALLKHPCLLLSVSAFGHDEPVERLSREADLSKPTRTSLGPTVFL